MTRGMAGTRRGVESCAGCSHPRLAHLGHGIGRCTRTVWVLRPGNGRVPDSSTPELCPCVTYIERKV